MNKSESSEETQGASGATEATQIGWSSAPAGYDAAGLWASYPASLGLSFLPVKELGSSNGAWAAGCGSEVECLP